MWLTQTYLNSSSQAFRAYCYLLFNPYTDWASGDVKSLKSRLAQLGRRTTTFLSIQVPDEDVDRTNIGEELNQRFAPLVSRLNKSNIYTGLLVLDKPLEKISADASDARWCFLRLEKDLSLPSSAVFFEEVMKSIERAAVDSSDDVVQNVVRDLLPSRKRGGRLLKAVSVSASGPSANLGALRDALSGSNHLDTNIYD